MADILLATLNARYIHASFGLRYLLANLGALRERATLLEFDVSQRPIDVAEALLSQDPKVIGLGVYIWNVEQTGEVISIVKRVRPDVCIILGGPEVSHEVDANPVTQLADYVITGEADLAFAQLCRQVLEGNPPGERIISAAWPQFSELEWPYPCYTAQDIENRVIYVEASRGCPFSCEFCLSSLDVPVRQAPVAAFIRQLEQLLERGVQQFKFVDRTFNLSIETSTAILEFLLSRLAPGRFFHFELIPDRLPPALRSLVAKFPAGTLQFEVGIQTFNPVVASLISRRQNYERLEDNLRFLRSETGVHIHADLIAGLPGETLESFAAGFDRLVALRPQEIQVGILKRLRGTPIVRHDAEWGMVYNAHAPYEILQNKLLDFGTLQKLRRFARIWDLVPNSGNFPQTAPLIWAGTGSPFYTFMEFCEWLYPQIGKAEGVALVRLMELLFRFLASERGVEKTELAKTLWSDYVRGGRTDKPRFLKDFLPAAALPPDARRTSGLPKRQARHLA